MKIIGLTGGIASGKSTVAKMLRKMGAIIINADEVARQVVEPGQPAWKDIVGHFGDQVLNPDGTINRDELGRCVFNNTEYLHMLNEMTHPRIMDAIKENMRSVRDNHPGAILILEVPLLYETYMDKICDEVWVVWVDHETQIKRLMARDGISREDALKRINTQMPLDEKARRADVVIDNRFSVEETRQAVTRYFTLIQSSSSIEM